MRNSILHLEFFTVMFLCLCIMSHPIYSADFHDVVINEIAWMGTEASSTDEWIELYNNTDTDVDLTGWTLVFTDDDPIINLNDTIPANGFLLLERTDDQTISDISADHIYSGNLGNTGENLILKDSVDQTIDVVDCIAGWFAGLNSPKMSMERIRPDSCGSDSSNWDNNDGIIQNGMDANGDPICGTPGAENSVYQIVSFIAEVHSVPEKSILINNYPNPFNPVTTIPYQIDGQDVGKVISLQVYDMLGHEVTTLMNKVHQPGQYSVNWNGCDDAGRETPSGIYFYQLKSGGEVIQTRKMLKIK